MEKKKLLLVSVSVGLFLVIVIGVSILAFTPRDYSAAASVRTAESAQVRGGSQISGQTDGSGEVPPPVPALETVRVQPDGQEQPSRAGGDNVIYINGSESLRVERGGDGVQAYINVQSAPPAAAPKAETAKNAPRAKAGPAAGTTKQSAAPAKPKPAARGSDYWVQTGSFTTKSHADKARDFLAGKGIASIVQDGTVQGKVYYRVRVGPYTTQTEANYWLGVIKTIDGMEKSIVWKGADRS